MKKILILFIWMLAISAGLQAQLAATETIGATPVLPMAPELAKQATDNLNSAVVLNAAQYNKVLEANKKYYLTLEGYMAAGGNNRDSINAVMMADRNARLKAILSSQQMQKAQQAKVIQ